MKMYLPALILSNTPRSAEGGGGRWESQNRHFEQVPKGIDCAQSGKTLIILGLWR